MLTKEAVVAAAFEYADRYGLDALSMRKLADALGIKAMSLYNHVEDKERLVDALVERVVEEMEAPAADAGWIEAMRRRAVSARAALKRHPWAALPLVSRFNIGPASLRYFERSLACLRRAGFSPIQADQIVNAFDSYVYGFVLIETRFPVAADDIPAAAADTEAVVPIGDYPAIAELSRMVVERSYDGLPSFERGLDFLCEGVRGKP